MPPTPKFAEGAGEVWTLEVQSELNPENARNAAGNVHPPEKSV